MPEQATSAAPQRDEELAELREELYRSREEVLRLRDLLITRDAELGTARGRVTELEATAGKLISFVVRAKGVRGLAQAGVNRLRGFAERRD